jgi:cell division initiation protein
MEISARTLREVEFSGSLRGYNTDEVDEFLEKVAVAVDALQAELQVAVERAQRQAVESPDRPDRPALAEDDPIRRTLVLAQRTADLAIKEAQEEAAQIVNQARSDGEATVAEAKRSADRISEEGQRHLREEVLRLTAARDGLRNEVDTLTTLLTAERERLTESLGAALRYVERSLTPSGDLASLPRTPSEPAGAGVGSGAGPRAVAPKEPSAPAAGGSDPVGSVAPVTPMAPSPAAPTAPASTPPSTPPSTAEESVETGVPTTLGPAADEPEGPEGGGVDTTDDGGDEPIVTLLSDETARPARAQVTGEASPAGDSALGEFDDWGLDEDVAPARAERLVTPAASSSSRAAAAATPTRSLDISAGSWAGTSAERVREEDDLDDLEAAIAEDAAAAAPSSRSYDDEFSWDARRTGRKARTIGRADDSQPGRLASPPNQVTDDTMQDAVVWHMNPGDSDTPA